MATAPLGGVKVVWKVTFIDYRTAFRGTNTLISWSLARRLDDNRSSCYLAPTL